MLAENSKNRKRNSTKIQKLKTKMHVRSLMILQREPLYQLD